MAKITDPKPPDQPEEGSDPPETAGEGTPEAKASEQTVMTKNERTHERENAEEKARALKELDDAPVVKVLGYMDGSIAVRLGWKHGMHVVSNSRFKFMREDLDMNILDDPDDYLF